jgi:DNA-binding transcriptional LysR family regulator
MICITCYLPHSNQHNQQKKFARMHGKLVWDDLLHVLAVGRLGSLSAAARHLGVNHSTVFRRIAGIEARLQVRLFDRQPRGQFPTAAGEAMIAAAEQMEAAVIALERELAGTDLRPSGTVRLAASPTLLPVLTGVLKQFQADYPDIRVELVTGVERLNLSRREADIALRATNQPDDQLVGRKLSRIGFAVHGAGRHRPGANVASLAQDHAWIGLDDGLSHIAAWRWLAHHVPPQNVRLTVASLDALLACAAAGMGLALLPCYMAEGVPGLVRMSPPLPEVTTDLWLLVHEDLRHATRVRALINALTEGLGAMRPLFEGQAASGCA